MHGPLRTVLLVVVLSAAGCAAPEATDDDDHELPPPSEDDNNGRLLRGGDENVTAGWVAFGDGDRGYLAAPTAPGARPAVVMIHEWWGLNGHIRTMARTLASAGYAVLAVDLYDGEVAVTVDEARALVGGFDPAEGLATMRAAVSHLRAGGATAVASLGWCFGGGQSLQLAISGEAMDATVMYYGNVVTDPDRLRPITWPVLGVFGALDQGIPVADVERFEEALDGLGVSNEIHVYDGVGHAFANPSGPAYAPDEAMDAWARTLAFLDQALGV